MNRRRTNHLLSTLPHTYGLRVCSCAAFSTEPCRPTACGGVHPHPAAYPTTANYSLHTANSTAATPISLAHPILHSTFCILHWTYTFSAKEKDSETGLSYFGSRYYSSDLSVWLSVDPMASKYPSLSPYTYCANNPVRVVDPDGETIDPASQDEWNRNKQQITSTIMNRLFQLVTNTEENSSYTNKSIMSLFNTLTVMDQMEQDPVWMFSLSSINGKTPGYTKLTRDSDHNMAYLFQIGYVDIANFVHEVNHCGQFLGGKLGFIETDNGFGALVDVYDELEAYKSQYYYSQSSLPQNEYPILTLSWLRNIKDDYGDYPYRKDGSVSYDGYATGYIMKTAYPKISKQFDNMRGCIANQRGAVFNLR